MHRLGGSGDSSDCISLGPSPWRIDLFLSTAGPSTHPKSLLCQSIPYSYICYAARLIKQEVFLFEAASDLASDEESVKLCEVLPERAGLIMIEGGCATLSTDGHEVGCHRGGNRVFSR